MFNGISHFGADGIQVDIGHGGYQCRFIEQRLGFKSGLPEVAGAVIFGIGLAGNGLIEAAHKPGQVRESTPPSVKAGIDLMFVNIR